MRKLAFPKSVEGISEEKVKSSIQPNRLQLPVNETQEAIILKLSYDPLTHDVRSFVKADLLRA